MIPLRPVIPRFFLLLLLLPFSAAAQDDSTRCKQWTDNIADLERQAQERKAMQGYYKTTASEEIDVTYYRCAWNIDPGVRAISGQVTVCFRYKSDAASVTLDLSDALTVDSILHQGHKVPFSHSSNILTATLGSTYPAGNPDSIQVVYHGEPANSGLGSFTKTSRFVSTTKQVPIIWTLSEPYGAMDWWPCKNSLGDKADSLDVSITTPAAYKGVSNGLKIAEDVAADGLFRTIHWKHRYPITSYLVCLAVTDYVEFNKSVRLGNTDLPMQTFCYPESKADFEAQTQSTLDALQLFHTMFGDYPFIREKYGHTQFSWGGGEEHQTNSFVINPSASLCAHELAHQWFGDKITCASFVDIWLNEGFASQLASIFMELREPATALQNRQTEIARITALPGGSVKVDDTTNLNRIFDNRLTYLKGSHLLYMLRWKMGETAFLSAVRNYLLDPELAYHYAHTEDLIRHLKAAGGEGIDEFFAQWYSGQGYPSYTVQWAQIGYGTVKIKMNQVTSHKSVPLFTLPVALRFKNATESKTVVVDNKRNGEIFIRDIGFIADTVEVDPEYWLITKNNKTERLDTIGTYTEDIVVYPNPATEDFQLLINNMEGPYIYVQLYDVTGKLLFQEKRNLYNNREFIHIPAQQLAAGVYVLRVIDGKNSIHTRQLLKR